MELMSQGLCIRQSALNVSVGTIQKAATFWKHMVEDREKWQRQKTTIQRRNQMTRFSELDVIRKIAIF